VSLCSCFNIITANNIKSCALNLPVICKFIVDSHLFMCTTCTGANNSSAGKIKYLIKKIYLYIWKFKTLFDIQNLMLPAHNFLIHKENAIPQLAEGIMAYLWRDFWKRETGTGQQVAQLHDRYMMMMTKKIQQDATVHQNFIPYLNEAQHVSDDTPPIIRSLKLH